MGSYGIGVERIVASHIEQSHDENGIIWDTSIAPFDVHLIGINMKNESVRNIAEEIYRSLTGDGYEVLFDDRDEVSAGFKFKDADLLGMPVQIILGEKNLAAGKVEVKIRRTGERILVARDNMISEIAKLTH
jgi:prolyl-tRNA synthetase